MVAELRPSHLLLAAVLCLAAATARAADQPETAASKQNVKDFLDAHNEVRKKYGLPPLVWDKEVSRAAHHHGNVLIKTCTMYHSENNKYGENLFLGEVAEQWDPIKIVYSWANESLWWDRGTLGCAKGPDACGHFTQIVWYDTQRLGCKMLKCVDKPGVIGICEYDPPGNYAKEDPLVSHKEKRDRETKPSTGGQAPAPSASQAAPPPEPTQDQAAPPPEPTQGQAPPPPEPTQGQAPPPPGPMQGQAPPPPAPTQGQAPPPPEPTQGQAPPPPEQAQAPPDQTQTPPAQGQASSEQTQIPAAQGQASSEQTQAPPAQGQASSEQTQTPAAQGQATSGQAQAPPEQNQVQAVQSQVVQSQVHGQGQDMQSQVQDMQKQMQEQVQKQVQDIQNQMQTPGVQVVTSVHPTMQVMPSVHQ